MDPDAPRLRVVLNPHGGGGRAERCVERLRSSLEGRGTIVQVHVTQAPGDARDLAAMLPLSPGEVLVVAGGDGTLQQVVDGLFARSDGIRPDLALLPAGTGNALACDLGLRDAGAAVDGLLSGRRRPLDVLRLDLDGRRLHALGIVGWGLAADAGLWAERLRRLGPWRYVLGSLLASLVSPVARRATVGLDDERHAGTFAMMFAANTRTTGAGMMLAPGARLDDGLLDVLLLPRLSRLHLLWLLAGIGRGRHLRSPHLVVRRVRRLTLELEEQGLLNVDGELLRARSLQVEVLPRALVLRA